MKIWFLTQEKWRCGYWHKKEMKSFFTQRKKWRHGFWHQKMGVFFDKKIFFWCKKNGDVVFDIKESKNMVFDIKENEDFITQRKKGRHDFFFTLTIIIRKFKLGMI